MAEKNAKIYLWTVLALAVTILLAVWLGNPEDVDAFNVTLSAGDTPGTVQISNIQDSYQYSLDGGVTWVNIASDDALEIPAEVGDTLIIRDVDITGLAERYEITADILND